MDIGLPRPTAATAGPPAGCVDALFGNPLLVDQRGAQRPVRSGANGTARCAIGAYEADATVLTNGPGTRTFVEGGAPVVLRGLAADWPATRAAALSATAFRDYCAGFSGSGEIEAFVGDASIKGAYYYRDTLDGFNFDRRRMTLQAAIDAVVAMLDTPAGESLYAGSVPVADHLRGFAEDNVLPLPARAGARIWLGHAANIACHYDTLDNIACVVAGRRRFTLYPPAAIADLYVGPIDNTMAGQPVSLAAATPDAARFPRFAAAQERALTADLAPGDALYLPKLWWHRVESTAPFNVLVNYWWDATAAGPDAPYATLLLAMIAITLWRRHRSRTATGGRIAAAGYGTLAGFTTMVANAGGPVMSMYFLASRTPVMVFLGTSAWFFAIVNLVKVPFLAGLGLFTPSVLLMDLVLAPLVVIGALIGLRLAKRMPQRLFDRLVIGLTIGGSLYLLV